MVFRKLYWVTEQGDGSGDWSVSGVYTSVTDLIDHGLRWIGGSTGAAFRITLVKLDSAKEPLGSWASPEFSGLESGLDAYVKTGEFTEEDRLALRRSLDAFVSGAQV
jgi:hypothetical protein